jgi:uncharacterized protein YaaQ
MKLLMAIVRDDYAADVNYALANEGFSSTRISTTGGFWRRGNVTFLIGVENDQVEKALNIIDANAGPEIEVKTAPETHPPHRATVFVLDTEAFARY